MDVYDVFSPLTKVGFLPKFENRHTPTAASCCNFPILEMHGWKKQSQFTQTILGLIKTPSLMIFRACRFWLESRLQLQRCSREERKLTRGG